MASIPYAKLPPLIKYIIFYGAFAVLFAFYAIIVGGAAFGFEDYSVGAMENIASFAPIVLKELSVPGEVVPALLGGLMAWTAPSRSANVQVVLLLLLAAAAWLMYLHMQVFFAQPATRDLLLSGSTATAQVDNSIATLSSFASNVRSFAAVVFAAVLGLRFNDDTPVLNPPPAVAAPDAHVSK